jgi:hypothetical protein
MHSCHQSSEVATQKRKLQRAYIAVSSACHKRRLLLPYLLLQPTCTALHYCTALNILLLLCIVSKQMLTGRNRQMMQYIKDMFLTQDLPVMLSNESTFTTMDMIRSYTPKLHREDQVCACIQYVVCFYYTVVLYTMHNTKLRVIAATVLRAPACMCVYSNMAPRSSCTRCIIANS